MSLVLVFVDGVGLGREDPAVNPLAEAQLDILANFLPSSWSPPPKGGRTPSLPEVHRRTPLPFGGLARATDASLGIPGLPQSATGQTTLLTGVNGGEALGGRHYTGFPTATLKKVIAAHSIFLQLAESGRSATFVNAFGPGFFEQGDAVWEIPFLGATTWANKAGGQAFRTFEDLVQGRAVFHDITHDTMAGHKRIPPEHQQPPRSVESAAQTMAWAAEHFDFVLFEFFQTDKAGHSMDRKKAVRELEKLEAFLTATLSLMDLERDTLLLTSDHGNVENITVRTHTHNPVPALMFGRDREFLSTRLGKLEDFTPAVLRILSAAS